MTPHDRIVETSRESRKTGWLVAILYIAIGIVITGYGAWAVNVVITFVGLMIVNFSFWAAVLLWMLMRLGERVSIVGERIRMIDEALLRVEHEMMSEPAPEEAVPFVDHRQDVPPAASVPVHSAGAEQSTPAAAEAPTLEGQPAVAPMPPMRGKDTRFINLAHVQAADLQPITGAVLDRSQFPRLASFMAEHESPLPGQPIVPEADERDLLLGDELDDEMVGRLEADVRASAGHEDASHPGQDGSSGNGHGRKAAEESVPTSHAGQPAPADAAHDADVGAGHGADTLEPSWPQLNVSRAWKVAVRSQDLRSARQLFSAFVDTVEPRLVDGLRRELLGVERQVEHRLRETFAAAFRRRDYAAALEIGREMRDLLPDHPVSREFLRIEPHLIRRRQAEANTVSAAL